MKSTIKLNQLTDINEFCRRAQGVLGGVIAERGRYKDDGASYLGVISINPTLPFDIVWDEKNDTLAFTEFTRAFEV